MQSRNSHKSLILIVVLAAIAVGYVTVFFMPQQRHIAKLQKDLFEKRAFIEQSEKTSPRLQAIEDRLATTLAYNKAWTKHAPRPGEISVVLGKINALARSSNVAVESFDPEPAEKFERLRVMPLALECSGRLTEIFAFLAELEHMPQTIWVKEATIEQIGNRGKSKNGQYTQCEMSVAIFMDNIGISN